MPSALGNEASSPLTKHYWLATGRRTEMGTKDDEFDQRAPARVIQHMDKFERVTYLRVFRERSRG